MPNGMTKLRRSGSVDLRSAGMSNVLDVAKALCLACKHKGQRRSLSLFQIKSCPGETLDQAYHNSVPRMEGSTLMGQDQGHSRSASGASAASVAMTAAAASRSISMNSISSDGSADSHVVEQEDIIVLTHDVKSFKEALGKLRRIFHPERDKSETMRISAHERLGEVLRILRSILEKYPPIQSTELLMAAGTLIQQVKSYNYEDEKADPSDFFDAIDQLALAFSSRSIAPFARKIDLGALPEKQESNFPLDVNDIQVSEYLMGDLDSSSQPVPKTKSCDNLLSADGESDPLVTEKRFASTTLTPQEIDARLLRLGDGVDLALRRAKVWSKYAKDVMIYIEKRCSLEAEHARSLIKLAQTMRPILKEENFLPFQSIYCMALDQDFENAQTSLSTCSLLQGYKFIEPLTARRNEHEKCRKQIKETWHRELKRMHESITNMRKAKALYLQRHQEYEKAKDSAMKAESNESTEASKVDKKRRVEDDACQKAMEAETTYKACVVEANERQLSLEKVKAEVLQQVRELIYQCDQTMKAVTVGYFQLQHTISAPAPVQFQTLCESSRLYEPGTQYMEFVKRLPLPLGSGSNGTVPYSFEPYSSDSRLDKARRSNGSTESGEDILNHSFLDTKFSAEGKDKARAQQPTKAWSPATQPAVGSDSDSMSSCPSNKSQDTSPAASPHINSRKVITISSGDELETDHDTLDSFGNNRRTCMSKAAETHVFRKLKTPSRCRECDSYVYFHGFECLECGLASHKKCLESLAIQCGRKRLPRKMTTFGVDLTTHAVDSGEDIPYIVNKCITEIEDKGICIKGIYRVSGVKSKVEKLCQSFENGAELVDLDGVHPNVVANVLKLYLRQKITYFPGQELVSGPYINEAVKLKICFVEEVTKPMLPEPLLTFRLYPEFIKLAKDFPAQKDEDIHLSTGAIEDLQKLVLRLPAVHLATLTSLMHHLNRISQHSDHNNMPPSNLGIVFGPTLLRTSEGSASLSSLVDTVHQTRVIELLITHAYEIFGPPPHPSSSEKEDVCLRNPPAKLARRYRDGAKRPLGRTASGTSQTSDIDDLHVLDTSSDPILDVDDYPLPGYLRTDKSLDLEISQQGSDATHLSDDLLYSAVMSDDDFPEILLPDDSVFKKSPLLPRCQTQYAASRTNNDCTRSGQSQNLMKVHDARASLSSSPAVSEASQCSSHIRSTDEDSVHGSDAMWKESAHPTPPARKNAPSTLQLNQSFLHSSLDRKQCLSSVSESSGVSSAASTSPTGASDTSQNEPGNVYTSTAMVTLAGQKVQTSPSGTRSSTSSMTAELRRQFFETPALADGSATHVNSSQRGSTASQTDTVKCVTRTPSESQSVGIPSALPNMQSQQRSTSLPHEINVNFPNFDGKLDSLGMNSKSQEEPLVSQMETSQLSTSLTFGCAFEGKSSAQRYVSPLGLPSYRPRGSINPDSSSSLTITKDEKFSLPHDYDPNETMKVDFTIAHHHEASSQDDISLSGYKTSTFTTSKSVSGEKCTSYSPHHSSPVLSSQRQEVETSEVDVQDAKDDMTLHQDIELPQTVSRYVESTSSMSIVSEGQIQDRSMRMAEKLSLSRQPRFV